MVLRGHLNKYGNLVGPVPDATSIAKNDWDYRVVSVTLQALSEDIDEILEFGCSFNTSSCYNFELERFLDRNTPFCVRHVKIAKNETKTIQMDSAFPWLRIDNVSDKVHLSFVKAGTDVIMPKDSLLVIAHIAIKRIK